MAKFRIWCRTDEVGPNQFLSVVTAIPDDLAPASTTSRIESESRLMSTRAGAIEQCAHMATGMGDRLRKRGDEVSMIEAV